MIRRFFNAKAAGVEKVANVCAYSVLCVYFFSADSAESIRSKGHIIYIGAEIQSAYSYGQGDFPYSRG